MTAQKRLAALLILSGKAGHAVADGASCQRRPALRGQGIGGRELIAEQGRAANVGDDDGAECGVGGRLGEITRVGVKHAAGWRYPPDVADSVEHRLTGERLFAGGKDHRAEAR